MLPIRRRPERRRLGRISKRGDVYLRTLLIHGARAVLNAAAMAREAKNREFIANQSVAKTLHLGCCKIDLRS